jgi:O-antigen biosynthesis protein WbqV
VKDSLRSPFSKGLFADLFIGLIAILIGVLASVDYEDNTSHIIIIKILIYFGALFFALLITKSWQMVWRWTTSDDLMRISQAVLIAALIYCGFVITSNMIFTPKLPLMVSLLLLSFMMGARGLARLTSSGGNIMALSALFRPAAPGAPPAIMVGSTEAVTLAIHQARKNGPLPFKPLAIISTKGNQIGKVFSGARVYSGENFEETLQELIKRALNEYNYEKVRIILVGDNHPEKVKQAAMGAMNDEKVRLSRMPEIGSKKLANVNPEDVLGRRRHILDPKGPSRLIEGKTVLITGGGGTIGSELALQVASFNPKRIIIVDNSENNLYTINQIMSERFPNTETIIRLKDIRDYRSIDDLFDTYLPQIVFHAAANKHVPLMEEHPREALMVNLGGTKNVADAALRTGVEVFILISTDKAVNPSNLMGTAKRAAELYVRHCFEKENCQFFSTRFGNVLGSSGSVMPLFERQISAMGPVTVTSKEMTRWFMTVKEAVGLVLQSAALGGGMINGTNGKKAKYNYPLFVLDMGEPIKIVSFAEAMIRLKGYEPYKDIQIIETGIRPGEKLHEEIFYDNEKPIQTPVDGVLGVKTSKHLDENLIELIEKTVKAATKNEIREALKLLERIVPEYKVSKK